MKSLKRTALLLMHIFLEMFLKPEEFRMNGIAKEG